MDYKEQIEQAKHAAEKWREKHRIVGVGELRVDCMVDDLTRSITDLLARAEAAEARAEKAERERDEYFKHLQGLCFCCGHRTDGFDCNAKCYGHKRGTAWVYAGPMKEE